MTEIRQKIDCLKNLKDDPENLLMINLLCRKLDFASKREYESKRDISKLPTISEFFDILEERCRVLATLAPTVNKGENFVPKKTVSHHSKTVKNNSPLVDLSENSSKCLFCKSAFHKIYQCSKFLACPNTEKIGYVKCNGMCYNCLGTRHTVSNCSSRGCSICSKRHQSHYFT